MTEAKMALLNGQSVSFNELSFIQVGEKILDSSPSGDGKGIVLVLTHDEEVAFERAGGMAVGYSIATLVADAVKKRTGEMPKGLKHAYSNRQFTT
jgi:hypothetical protein